MAKKRVIVPLGPDVSVREGSQRQKYIDALVEESAVSKLNEGGLIAFTEGDPLANAPSYIQRKDENGKLVLSHEWAGHLCAVKDIATDAKDSEPKK